MHQRVDYGAQKLHRGIERLNFLPSLRDVLFDDPVEPHLGRKTMKWYKRQEGHHTNFAGILCPLSKSMQAKLAMSEQYILPEKASEGK